MGLFDTIGYKGIGNGERITFKHSTLKQGTHEGQPAKMSDNDTVVIADDGDDFIGVLEHINDKTCTIVLRGMVELVYADTLTGQGWKKVSSAVSGKIKENTSGTSYRIFNNDTVNKKVWLYLG